MTPRIARIRQYCLSLPKVAKRLAVAGKHTEEGLLEVLNSEAVMSDALRAATRMTKAELDHHLADSPDLPAPATMEQARTCIMQAAYA